jgi:hypothetical protein
VPSSPNTVQVRRDSSVTLRSHKRQGWLLDAEGRAIGEAVPIPI